MAVVQNRSKAKVTLCEAEFWIVIGTIVSGLGELGEHCISIKEATERLRDHPRRRPKNWNIRSLKETHVISPKSATHVAHQARPRRATMGRVDTELTSILTHKYPNHAPYTCCVRSQGKTPLPPSWANSAHIVKRKNPNPFWRDISHRSWHWHGFCSRFLRYNLQSIINANTIKSKVPLSRLD